MRDASSEHDEPKTKRTVATVVAIKSDNSLSGVDVLCMPDSIVFLSESEEYLFVTWISELGLYQIVIFDVAAHS